MPPDLFEEYTYVTWTHRGLNMVETAQKFMSEGKKVFFITGISHMIREDGIVDTLRERGYTVNQIFW
jgi:uncharacterized protein YbaP (TraB family)